MQNSEKLILGRGLVEVGCLLVDEERIRDPDQVDVLSTNDQLLQTWPPLKGQPRIGPELSEVHVHREVLKWNE